MFITNIAFKLSLYVCCILFHVDASGGDNADLITTLIDVIVYKLNAMMVITPSLHLISHFTEVVRVLSHVGAWWRTLI